MILGNLSLWDQIEFQRRSRQLDLLSRGDYSPIKEELQKAYPRTQLPVRAIPFVQRYVAELSGLYSRAVVRRFSPSTLPQPTWQKLQAVYTASKIDRVLDATEQALWVQNSIIGLPIPDGIGKVRLQTFLPWQVEDVQVSDAMRADDPAYWTKLLLTVPVQVAAGQTIMGRMTLTPTEAWRQVGGAQVGIYSPDGSHPFGKIPVCVAHRVMPDPGRPLAPVNEAVLNLQTALSLQQADNELTIRHCAFPQKVIEGGHTGMLAEEIALGPDKVYVIPRSGDPSAPSPTFRVVQGQVPVAELVSFAEHQIRLYCAMLGLDPSAFLRVNTAVTASARMFAAQDRQVLRDRIKPVLVQYEQDLLTLIAQVLALREPMPLPADLSVDVQWMTVDPSPDRQADAQALTAEVALGISSPVDVVAQRDGVGHTEALRTVTRNLEEARSLGLIADPAQTEPGTPGDGSSTAISHQAGCKCPDGTPCDCATCPTCTPSAGMGAMS